MTEQPPISCEPWSFSSPEIALPAGAGLGRLENIQFDSGFRFYRTEFRVDKTCVVPVNRPGLETLLCSQIFLTGENSFRTAAGTEYRANSEKALLYRLDPRLEMIIPGGQVIRHVGVSADYQQVLSQLSPPQRDLLSEFDTIPATGAVVHAFAFKQALRRLASQAFSHERQQGVGRMALEGMAMHFFATLLTEFFDHVSATQTSAHTWQNFAVDDMMAYIDDNLDQALNDELLAERFSLSRNAVRTACQEQCGVSLAQLLRQRRMIKARALVIEGHLPVKAVAQEVGYRHVSNFNAAYKHYYGETPGATQRLEWAPVRY